MRTPGLRAICVGIIVLGAAGCASPRMEREVRDARAHAAVAEHRTAELDARLRAMETSMVFQQSMLGRAMAKQDATDRNIAALGDGLRPAQPTAAQVLSAQPTSAPPAKELVDLSGQALVVGADDATVRDILGKVEAYMGRSLTPQERQTLGQVLRRPRVIDTTNPWGPSGF